MSSIASSDLIFSGGGRTRPLSVRRMSQAHGLRLMIDPRDGAVRLTMPARAPLRHALDWVEGKRGWIEAELAKLPDARPIAPGSTIMFQGTPVTIDWRRDAPRAIRHEVDRLIVGGPSEALAPRIVRWLRTEALTVLEAETRTLAARAGVTVAKVAIGDPRARWGSCSATGTIRYSWRLILAPPAVREATVAHEVAHLLHMDHSAAFHAAVKRLLGRDPGPERRWLRVHGPTLYWLGRE